MNNGSKINLQIRKCEKCEQITPTKMSINLSNNQEKDNADA